MRTLTLSGVGDKAGSAVANIATVTIAPTRRSGHGETAWPLRTDPLRLRQPQDGALDVRAKLATLRPKSQLGLLQEPEDASLTGGTRSLRRRLMGLNVESLQRVVPAIVSGSAPRTKVA